MSQVRRIKILLRGGKAWGTKGRRNFTLAILNDWLKEASFKNKQTKTELTRNWSWKYDLQRSQKETNRNSSDHKAQRLICQNWLQPMDGFHYLWSAGKGILSTTRIRAEVLIMLKSKAWKHVPAPCSSKTLI